MKILITGGTSGIGKAIVKDLANDHDVAFIGRNEDRGTALAEETGAHFLKADLTDAQECAFVVDKFYGLYGQCDVAILNAGLWTEGAIEEADADEINKVFEINTISPVVFTSEIVKRMKKSIESGEQKSARILFTNSQAGLAPKALRSVYNASKWAITGFARSLSLELSPDNIGVTNLCPGYVGTELFENAGYPRDTDGSMAPDNIASAVRFIVELPAEVTVNEFGIKPTLYS